jgi:RNA polymerase sigma factor (sigma-70 family)
LQNPEPVDASGCNCWETAGIACSAFQVHPMSVALSMTSSSTSKFPADPDVVLLDCFRRDGDRAALEELVRHHIAAAYHVARAFAGPSEAEDVVQEAFIEVMRSADHFRGYGSVRSWIVGIVVNRARMQHRERIGRRRREWEFAQRSHVAVAVDDRIGLVWGAVAGLPHRYAHPLALHYRLGLGIEEIASTMRCSVNTVKTRLRRGLERVRRQVSLVLGGISLTSLLEILTAGGPQAVPPGLIERISGAVRTIEPAKAQVPTWIALGFSAVIATVLVIIVGRWVLPQRSVHAPLEVRSESAQAADPPAPVDDLFVGLELVPASAKFLLRVDAARFIRLVTPLEPILERMSAIVAAAGYGTDDLAEVVGVSDVNSWNGDAIGLHVRMRADAQDVDAAAIARVAVAMRGTVTAEPGQGLDRYRILAAEPWGTIDVLVLGAHRVAIGRPRFVDAVLDVRSGKVVGLAAGAPLLNAYRCAPPGAIAHWGSIDGKSTSSGSIDESERPGVLAYRIAYHLASAQAAADSCRAMLAARKGVSRPGDPPIAVRTYADGSDFILIYDLDSAEPSEEGMLKGLFLAQ